jgi:hypothetical protein
MITWQPGLRLDELEKLVILKAYSHYGRNKTKTAEGLGIAIRTIDAKFAKYAEEDIKKAQLQEEKDLKNKIFLERSRGIKQVEVKEVKEEIPVIEEQVTKLKTKSR